MGAFNLAVVLPGDDAPNREQLVAKAMEPYRGTEWYGYSFEPWEWPGIYAYIDSLGQWVVGTPPEGLSVVIIGCKW